MSSWETLVNNSANNLIFEEEYKGLFGYPNGKYNSSLNIEVPGTSRINIFQNQIFSNSIPSTAPNTSAWTPSNVIDKNGIPCGTKYSSPDTNPPPVCYFDLSLSYIATADGTYPPNSGGLANGGRTYWTTAANSYGNDGASVVQYNYLNKAIPGNYDPAGSYGITVSINDGTGAVPFPFGNATFPWTLNTNSGILMFTGNLLPANISSASENSIPDISWSISITFWAYTGPTGSGGGGGDTIWQASNGLISPQSAYSDYTITGVEFSATSDYRIKEDVLDLDLKIYTVDNLRPVIYKKIDTNNINIGLIAHEVQEYFPFLVKGEKDGEETQSLNYIGLIGVLIKEIQELKTRLKKLENSL